MRIPITLVLFAMSFSIASQKKITTYYDLTKSRVQEEYLVDAAGQMNGYYKLYDDKGMLIEEGNFKGGRKNGEYKTYFNDGGTRRLSNTVNWSNGEEHTRDDWMWNMVDEAGQDPFLSKVPKDNLSVFESRKYYYGQQAHIDYSTELCWHLSVEQTPEGVRLVKVNTKGIGFRSDTLGATYMHNGAEFDIKAQKRALASRNIVLAKNVEINNLQQRLTAAYEEKKASDKRKNDAEARLAVAMNKLQDKEDEISHLQSKIDGIKIEREDEISHLQTKIDGIKIERDNSVNARTKEAEDKKRLTTEVKAYSDSVFYVISTAKAKNRIGIDDYCQAVIAMGKAGLGGFSKRDIEMAHVAYIALREAPSESDQISPMNERLAQGVSPGLLVLEIYNRNEGWYRQVKKK